MINLVNCRMPDSLFNALVKDINDEVGVDGDACAVNAKLFYKISKTKRNISEYELFKKSNSQSDSDSDSQSDSDMEICTKYLLGYLILRKKLKKYGEKYSMNHLMKESDDIDFVISFIKQSSMLSSDKLKISYQIHRNLFIPLKGINYHSFLTEWSDNQLEICSSFWNDTSIYLDYDQDTGFFTLNTVSTVSVTGRGGNTHQLYKSFPDKVELVKYLKLNYNHLFTGDKSLEKIILESDDEHRISTSGFLLTFNNDPRVFKTIEEIITFAMKEMS